MPVGRGSIDQNEIAVAERVIVDHVVQRVSVLPRRYNTAVAGPISAKSAEGAVDKRLDFVLAARRRRCFHCFAMRADTDLRSVAEQGNLGWCFLFAQLGIAESSDRITAFGCDAWSEEMKRAPKVTVSSSK